MKQKKKDHKKILEELQTITSRLCSAKVVIKRSLPISNASAFYNSQKNQIEFDSSNFKKCISIDIWIIYYILFHEIYHALYPRKPIKADKVVERWEKKWGKLAYLNKRSKKEREEWVSSFKKLSFQKQKEWKRDFMEVNSSLIPLNPYLEDAEKRYEKGSPFRDSEKKARLWAIKKIKYYKGHHIELASKKCRQFKGLE